jgi:XRE family aerobic/anaerobic benzoate catabolism transcriptional regulator
VLAKVSGISERYIAQLESGKGNVSIVLLRRVSNAMAAHLEDLIPSGEPAPDWPVIRDLVRKATPNQIAQAKDVLSGQGAAAQRRMSFSGIALIGLRGAGKSTLGAALAKQLDAPFIEIDKMIEREHGAPAATLFEVYGQGTFRRYERECLERIVAKHESAVIATAGGIVADERNFAQLLDQTHVVWLQASPAEHMRRVMEQGDFRPMAHNRDAMNDLVAILDARAAEYGRSHVKVDTSGKSVEGCVKELAEAAEGLFGKN